MTRADEPREIRLTTTALEKAARHSPTLANLSRVDRIAWLKAALLRSVPADRDKIHADISSAVVLPGDHLTELGDRLAALVEEDIASPGCLVAVTVKPLRSILRAPMKPSPRIVVAPPPRKVDAVEKQSTEDMLRKRVAELEAALAAGAKPKMTRALILFPTEWIDRIRSSHPGSCLSDSLRRVIAASIGVKAPDISSRRFDWKAAESETKRARVLATLRANPVAGDHVVARLAKVSAKLVSDVRNANGIAPRGKFRGNLRKAV